MSLDFFAGCMGGCAGVLVGHPLDTIKVHLQTQDAKNPVYRGTWDCMKKIVAQDKIRGLYRGITSPMAGVGFVNAIVFGVYGNVQRQMGEPNSLMAHCVAGTLAGLCQSVVCAPMELAKTRMQLQHEGGSGAKYKGPLDCLRHIRHTEGIRGTFKGLGITAARDVPGFATYFVSYEYMMRLTPEPHAAHSLLAGGLAGMISWLACYPMDVVKTCLQADGMSDKPQYKGVIDCAMKRYKSDGWQFFTRGLNSTLIRAFPMNAACFFVVSLIMRYTKTTDIDVVVQSGEPLAMIGVSNSSTPLCHMHQHQRVSDEIAHKRFHMAKSLKALLAFNEAVCQSEVEELANEFYPDDHKYYVFEDERVLSDLSGEK